MEAMLSLLWRIQGESFYASRIAVLDTWFTHTLANDYTRFQKSKNKSSFPWNSVIKNYVRGFVPSRTSRLAWFTHIDTVYVPMNWKKDHWVALVIQLKKGEILILDPFIIHTDQKKLPRLMKPIVDMLPCIIRDFVNPDEVDYPLPKSFKFERIIDVYQNKRSGDCGPLTVKFMELHGLNLGLHEITDQMVDEMRMKFAVDVYEHFIVSLCS